MRIAMFGGSFDPVHYGHLWTAEYGRESLGLDRVVWVPAATSPLKPGGPVATAAERLALLRLALSGSLHDVIDDREIRRGGVSYTVETLRELSAGLGRGDRLYLMMGSDSLASMDRWHQPELICQLATLAVVRRGGEAEIDFGILEAFAGAAYVERCRASVISMPLIEISSSELRRRASRGESLRYRTPRSVEACLESQRVYES